MDQPPTPSPAPDVEQDYVLRAQIATTEFFLKYGKYGGYLVGAILLGAFGYSSWNTWRHSVWEEQYGAISAIDYKMPKRQSFEAGQGQEMVLPDDTTDETLMANLAEGARRYEAVAAESTGTAQRVAWLKATEAWRRAGKPEEAATAATSGAVGAGTDAISYAADAQKFAALADAGKADDAEAQLRAMAGRYDGFFAEQALMRLTAYQLDREKRTEAEATFTELTTRFPTSFSADELGAVAERLGKTLPAPGAAPAAGAAAPAEGAPAAPPAPATTP